MILLLVTTGAFAASLFIPTSANDKAKRVTVTVSEAPDSAGAATIPNGLAIEISPSAD